MLWAILMGPFGEKQLDILFLYHESNAINDESSFAVAIIHQILFLNSLSHTDAVVSSTQHSLTLA